MSMHWGLDGQLTPRKHHVPGQLRHPAQVKVVAVPGMFLWQTEKAPVWDCSQVQSESARRPPPMNTMLPFFSLSSISFLHSSNFVLNFCASAERRDFLRTLRSEGDKSSKCEEPGLMKGLSHSHSDKLGHLT